MWCKLPKIGFHSLLRQVDTTQIVTLSCQLFSGEKSPFRVNTIVVNSVVFFFRKRKKIEECIYKRYVQKEIITQNNSDCHT